MVARDHDQQKQSDAGDGRRELMIGHQMIVYFVRGNASRSGLDGTFHVT